MERYEYTVIPAPRRGEKARGVKTTEERFALALTGLMNRMGAEGWDYVRADALPCEERAGLTGSKTTYHNVLVFRRVLEAASSLTLADDMDADYGAEEADAAPEDTGAEPQQRTAPDLPPLRLGAAEAPVGTAPVVGPAKPGLAAE